MCRDESALMAGCASSLLPLVTNELLTSFPEESSWANRMWLWPDPSPPSFHAIYTLPLKLASVGNSRLRMNCAGPSWKAPKFCGTEDVIGMTAPAVHVEPPSLEEKITSLKLTGA